MLIVLTLFIWVTIALSDTVLPNKKSAENRANLTEKLPNSGEK